MLSNSIIETFRKKSLSCTTPSPFSKPSDGSVAVIPPPSLSLPPFMQPIPQPTSQTSEASDSPSMVPSLKLSESPSMVSSSFFAAPTKTSLPSVAPSSSFPCFVDTPELRTNLEGWFANPTIVEDVYGLIGSWCFSTALKDMIGLFYNSPFNHDISSWNVESVTTMALMFANSPFSQNISSWNVASVIDMSYMLANSPFNHGISS